MMAVIRVRGSVRIRKEVEDTLRMLGLRKVNALSVLPRSDSILGMIKKVNDYVMWGEISDEMSNKIKNKKLKPIKKKSIKRKYPNGDLGYRKDMEDLMKRMIQ